MNCFVCDKPGKACWRCCYAFCRDHAAAHSGAGHGGQAGGAAFATQLMECAAFGRLKELQEGDTVRFTDMEGVVNTYAVSKCETLQPTEVDAVQNSGYDLVLYTCTLGGRTRVTVFCDRGRARASRSGWCRRPTTGSQRPRRGMW